MEIGVAFHCSRLEYYSNVINLHSTKNKPFFWFFYLILLFNQNTTTVESIELYKLWKEQSCWFINWYAHKHIVSMLTVSFPKNKLLWGWRSNEQHRHCCSSSWTSTFLVSISIMCFFSSKIISIFFFISFLNFSTV